MAQNPITCQQIVARGLRWLGVTSFNPSSPAGQAYPIEPTDIDDVLGCLNAAFQQYFKDGPSELRESNVGANINAPTQVAMDVTNGSTAIANFTGFSAWMTGCTCAITGDSQQNEITSAALLARPYEGSAGTQVTGTVYNDAVQLDWTVAEVLNPVFIASPSMTFLRPVTSRMEFAKLAGVPLVTTPDGFAYDWPFFWIVQKSISRPLWWYLEPAYYSALGYVPRRIRLAPMPNAQCSMGYRITSTATRYTQADVYVNSPSPYTDPGILLPVNDGEVESLLMPIFVKKLSELPTFKNKDCMPSILSAFQEAKDEISNVHAQADAAIFGGYM